ncbi:ABC transporter D family protein [Cavenderia fasciculata]|uniref:ABC transporter D family protein n=1 Tax=Cavenderia fasciculata TaxID=261658 RepID=F4Q3D6_CACFS|nr:ABC transporter D family protein [Cavenderia fasciculata]EGG16805.1 ABC transporter D family protein [Cavenderia fasciculata]|eukprot:XP_004355279.1 ABC transporter D family protein [Cavenderia fasciculata]
MSNLLDSQRDDDHHHRSSATTRLLTDESEEGERRSEHAKNIRNRHDNDWMDEDEDDEEEEEEESTVTAVGLRKRKNGGVKSSKSKIKRLLSTKDDRVPSTVESHLRRWKDIYNQTDNIKQKKETKYDFKLLPRRRSSEPTSVEENQARHQFAVLMKNKVFVIAFTYLLNLCSNLFTYLASLVNYFIIAIPLFLHWQTSIESFDVTTFSYNCIMLASGFSQYINVSTNISQMSSYIQRISTMIESCDQLYLQKKKEDQEKLEKKSNNLNINNPPTNHSIQFNSGNIIDNNNEGKQLIVNSSIESIILENVTYFTPKGRTLYSNVSFKVEKGNNLLIMGPSGCGKSSLVRVINGLWSHYTGTITRPCNNRLFFLSQQPYLIFGSLEDQIVYPYTVATHNIPPSELRELFDRLSMGYLIDREQEIKRRGDLNDLTHNWLNQLSPGEQQIISILRMFYHRPMFAMMDESTSSIPHATEDLVYQQCQQLGITVLSVGHRESLIKHHQQLLLFDNQMNWSVKQIN